MTSTLPTHSRTGSKSMPHNILLASIFQCCNACFSSNRAVGYERKRRRTQPVWCTEATTTWPLQTSNLDDRHIQLSLSPHNLFSEWVRPPRMRRCLRRHHILKNHRCKARPFTSHSIDFTNETKYACMSPKRQIQFVFRLVLA